ncbi:uncharacterized protein LOC134801443 [Cydia splendana]|uniref:uncharacterized protein LOC134801443 n=1 Tax=Cydia splendana TaxID=1100963 RepID=UPI00300D6235
MINTTLISYNCKNVKRSIDGIRQLCKFGDIIALQETWLLKSDLGFLTTVCDDFGCTGTSAVDAAAGILRGRPHGGVALLWRKSVFQCVSVIPCDSPRIVAIRATTSDKPILVISVYMPTDTMENMLEFTDCLSSISAIIDDSDAESVFILGDFNAHPGERFHNELVNFAVEQDWVCADLDILKSSGAFTFVSEAHGCRRWLDHCIVTKAALPCVTDVYVKYDVLWSDHFPLIVKCNLNLVTKKKNVSNLELDKVKWGERNDYQVSEYLKICSSKLKEIDFPVQCQECSGSYCGNVSHRQLIDKLYKETIEALCHAAAVTHIAKKSVGRRRLAGWNKHVSEAHRYAKLKLATWEWHGKPHTGSVYTEMIEARKVFKGRLKWCQNHQDQIKMDRLASHHSGGDFASFWKATNKLNPKGGVPVSVDGISNPREIADLFKDKFTLSSPLGPACRAFGAESQKGELSIFIYAKDISKVVKNMTKGKSPGRDGLSIEHLRHAGPHLPRVLSLLLNLCLGHSYLPPELLETLVVPVIKNRTGDASDGSNYRPISLATIVAKVFDSVLNSYLRTYIKLHDSQFGFRPGLSTEAAILGLKHTVKYYTDRKTPIYACFLDLSKAFDLVSYDILWQKLQKSRLPPEFIHLLRHWYLNQENRVRWAGELTEPYRLECGVRQGGLSSPILFNLYVDALIEQLSSAHVGCHVDGVCLNNISYADDMVLLAPSIGALRKLVYICESYASSHGLIYNGKKSEVMVFKAGSKCPSHVPPVRLNGTALERVSRFKYLGHIVTDDLKDDEDIERERRALCVRANMLARRFARCSKAVKITLFKAFCSSFYTGSLWVSYTQKAYNALRVVYNNAFRVLVGLPRFCSASAMFAEARTDAFAAIMRKKAASLLRRTRDSTNSILRMIADHVCCPIMINLIKLIKSNITFKY